MMEGGKKKYKVAIVDDHVLFASSLTNLINTFQGFEATFHVRNGLELQKKLEDETPDLILLDINMPVMDGYQTAEWLFQNHPSIKFLTLTMDDDEFAVLKMLRFGAKGYLLKDIHPDHLQTALTEVMETGYYHSSKVSDILVRSLRPENREPVQIKENELTFIKLACTELTYKEIADQMNLSPKTIDGYRQELFNRFHIKNRVGLVMFALKNNLFKI